MESSKIVNNIYKKGKIYKIVDVGYNEQYFGSTVVELSRRMSRHRAKYTEMKQKNPRIHVQHFSSLTNMVLKIVKLSLLRTIHVRARKNSGNEKDIG